MQRFLYQTQNQFKNSAQTNKTEDIKAKLNQQQSQQSTKNTTPKPFLRVVSMSTNVRNSVLVVWEKSRKNILNLPQNFHFLLQPVAAR